MLIFFSMNIFWGRGVLGNLRGTRKLFLIFLKKKIGIFISDLFSEYFFYDGDVSGTLKIHFGKKKSSKKIGSADM